MYLTKYVVMLESSLIVSLQCKCLMLNICSSQYLFRPPELVPLHVQAVPTAVVQLATNQHDYVYAASKHEVNTSQSTPHLHQWPGLTDQLHNLNHNFWQHVELL